MSTWRKVRVRVRATNPNPNHGLKGEAPRPEGTLWGGQHGRRILRLVRPLGGPGGADGHGGGAEPSERPRRLVDSAVGVEVRRP